MDAPFSYNDLELAKMTKTFDQDIFTTPKQSLCQTLVLIIFDYNILYKICRLDRDSLFLYVEFMRYSSVISNLYVN